jgi:hypothetical protein
MNSKSKKMWPTLATSLVLLTNLANADEMQMRNLENRVTALEQRKGSNGMINPPAHPVVKDGCDLWLEGEALYMHATEDGLGFGIKSDSGSLPDGHVKNLNYDWTWGFRVGAGYNLPYDGWDLFLNWTWFRSHEDKGTGTDANSIIFTTVDASSPNSASQFTKVEGHVEMHMNVVDLELGREFFVSKWLTLRPHAGLRGAWIHRHYEVEYKTPPGCSEVEDDFRNRYRGIGLRSGFDAQWGLGSGWSLFSQMAFSLLYGKHLLHFDEDSVNISCVATDAPNVYNRWLMVRAVTDLALGLRWDRLFFNDRYRIRLQAGWEQHMFFGFNKDMLLTSATAHGAFIGNKGDLAVSGFSFQARFDF